MSDTAIREKQKGKKTALALFLMLVFLFIGFWPLFYTQTHFKIEHILFYFLTFGAIYLAYDALIRVHQEIPFIFTVTENGFIFSRKLKSGDKNNYISFNDIIDCSFNGFGIYCKFTHKSGNTEKLNIDEGWEGYIIIANMLLKKLNKKGPNLEILRQYYTAPSVYDKKTIFENIQMINHEYK